MNRDTSITLEDLKHVFRRIADIENYAKDNLIDCDSLVILYQLCQDHRSIASRLSKSLYLSPAKTTRCLKRLVSLDLISESLDSDDYRKIFYKISGNGAALINEFVVVQGKLCISKGIEQYQQLKKAVRQIEQSASIVITSTAQKVIITLEYAKKPISVHELCNCVCLSQSKVSMSLKKLQGMQIAVRAPNGDDAREHFYKITDKGSMLAKEMIVILGDKLN